MKKKGTNSRPQVGKKQGLPGRPQQVVALAQGFAQPFGASALAARCALVLGLDEQEEDASALAVYRMGDLLGALCVAGRQNGLPNLGRPEDTLRGQSLYARMKWAAAQRPGLPQPELPVAAPPAALCEDNFSTAFFVRMLFSCLVDADCQERERLLWHKAPMPGLTELALAWQTAHTAACGERTPLEREREGILRACLGGAAQPQGLYTLTTPTASGQSEAAVAFALRHAAKHGLRRVFYVAPTRGAAQSRAAQLRAVLGQEAVQLATFGPTLPQEAEWQQAAPQWKAPVVCIAAEPLLCALYAAEPGACRGLHNLADSVLILEETQLLAAERWRPLAAALAQLVRHYGCTELFCSASRAVLAELVQKACPQPTPLRELRASAMALYPLFQRAEYHSVGRMTDRELARRMSCEHQSLCVAGSQQQAERIFHQLEGYGAMMLSPYMTGEHQAAVRKEAGGRLAGGAPCRLVAVAELVCGLELDFPTVYCEETGLDALLLAGGCCNREGHRDAAASPVWMFAAAPHAPSADRAVRVAAAQMVRQAHKTLASRGAIRAYFEALLHWQGWDGLDRQGVVARLEAGDFAFADVSRQVRPEAECTVYVPRGDGAALAHRLEQEGPSRALLAELEPYAVAVASQEYAALAKQNAVRPVQGQVGVLWDMRRYDWSTGLTLPQEKAG